MCEMMEFAAHLISTTHVSTEEYDNDPLVCRRDRDQNDTVQWRVNEHQMGHGVTRFCNKTELPPFFIAVFPSFKISCSLAPSYVTEITGWSTKKSSSRKFPVSVASDAIPTIVGPMRNMDGTTN